MRLKVPPRAGCMLHEVFGMVCSQRDEICKPVSRDARDARPTAGRPLSACLAQSVLTDVRIDAGQRASAALSALRASIESRGGSISLEKGPCGVRVSGEVLVYAGAPKTSSMARVGIDGKTDSMVLERSGTLDENVVNAVLGYGMGALDVSYLVQGGSAYYVIRTNGSLACQEDRMVQVAEALSGAAEIAEEMLGRVRSREASEPKEPLAPIRQLRNAA